MISSNGYEHKADNTNGKHDLFHILLINRHLQHMHLFFYRNDLCAMSCDIPHFVCLFDKGNGVRITAVTLSLSRKQYKYIWMFTFTNRFLTDLVSNFSYTYIFPNLISNPVSLSANYGTEWMKTTYRLRINVMSNYISLTVCSVLNSLYKQYVFTIHNMCQLEIWKTKREGFTHNSSPNPMWH